MLMLQLLDTLYDLPRLEKLGHEQNKEGATYGEYFLVLIQGTCHW